MATMAGKRTLIQRLAQGDDSAIEELYRQYTRAIRNFAFSLDPHCNEDRLHAIMLRMVDLLKRHRGDFDAGFQDRFTHWLYRVVRNVLSTQRRQHQRHSVHVSLEQEPMMEPRSEALTPAEQAVKAELGQLVRGRVDRLPPIYREVVVLYWDEGLKTPQIARRLGVDETVVRKRLERAYERLRADLGRIVTTLRRAVKSEA